MRGTGLISFRGKKTKLPPQQRQDKWLGLTIALFLGMIMVQDVSGCEMIQFPALPEEKRVNDRSRLPHSSNSKNKNNSSSYVNIGSYGMPMMKDTWYQIRPCKQGIGSSSTTTTTTGSDSQHSHNCDRCVRLESYHYPDHFLRQTPQGNIRLHPFPYAQRDHDTFHLDSSFCMTPTTTTRHPSHPPPHASDNHYDGQGGTRGGKNQKKRISLESVKHPGFFLSAVTMTKDHADDEDHHHHPDHHQSPMSSVVVDVGIGGFGMGGGDLRLSGGLKLVGGLEDPVTTPLWQQDQQLPDLALTFPCKGYYGFRQKEQEEEYHDQVHY